MNRALGASFPPCVGEPLNQTKMVSGGAVLTRFSEKLLWPDEVSKTWPSRG